MSDKENEEDKELQAGYVHTRKSLIARLDNWDDQKTWDDFYKTYCLVDFRLIGIVFVIHHSILNKGSSLPFCSDSFSTNKLTSCLNTS